MIVLAVRSGTNRLFNTLDSLKLQFGDRILVKTTEESADDIEDEPELVQVENSAETYRADKQLVALLIMAGVVGLAALGVYPILVTTLMGVVLMIFFGVLHIEDVYALVKWDIVFYLPGLSRWAQHLKILELLRM